METPTIQGVTNYLRGQTVISTAETHFYQKSDLMRFTEVHSNAQLYIAIDGRTIGHQPAIPLGTT